jgi:hypothetical protein
VTDDVEMSPAQASIPLSKDLSSSDPIKMPPFASNNPFRDTPVQTPSQPPLPPRPAPRQENAELSTAVEDNVLEPIEVDEEDTEDAELQKALALSLADADHVGSDTGIESIPRAERERSVRDSGAPPPSPNGEEGQAISSLFGPSEKDDKDGSMAMVWQDVSVAFFSRGIADDFQPETKPAVEFADDDIQRALEQSLLSASMHSVTAMEVDRLELPEQKPRESDV